MMSSPHYQWKTPESECGCKGIRTCLLCQSSRSRNSSKQVKSETTVYKYIYKYCLCCQRACLLNRTCTESLRQLAYEAARNSDDRESISQIKACNHDDAASMELPGIRIYENFVTSEEEIDLDKIISCTPFMKSQSGRQKQDFGPKVNFKRQKLKIGSFSGLPSYSRFLYERMKSCKVLEEFEPVEMCNLEYTSDRGAHIEPHFDDIWIWGERLVTVNLLSDSILSFTHDSHPDMVIRVPMPRRSLIVVSGPARYEWKHSIDSEHISGRRLAMTFRELSDEFKQDGVRSVEGQELLKVALSFKGIAVGCAS